MLATRPCTAEKPFTETEARTALAELFQLCFWLARHYARGAKPPDSLAFDAAKASAPDGADRQNHAGPTAQGARPNCRSGMKN